MYSGFEGDFQNELQACQCEPPGPVLEAPVQLKGWLLSRGTARSCRGRGRSRSWQRKQEACRQGVRLWGRGPWGAHACSSKDKPPPLTAPQGPSSGASTRVSENGKWVREGCFSDWGKHTCKHSQLCFSPCSQRAVCTSACTAAAAAAVNSGGLSNSLIICWQSLPELDSN